MGDGGLASPNFSLAKQYEKEFPFFLSIGMSYDQYWYGEPRLALSYYKAFEIEKERKNQEMWMNALYIYNTIGSFAEILPAFPKKGAKIHPFMKEPIPLTKKEMERRKERDERERFEKIKNKMMGLVKKGGENDGN